MISLAFCLYFVCCSRLKNPIGLFNKQVYFVCCNFVIDHDCPSVYSFASHGIWRCVFVVFNMCVQGKSWLFVCQEICLTIISVDLTSCNLFLKLDFNYCVTGIYTNFKHAIRRLLSYVM